MKRATLVKFFALLVGTTILYVGLCIAARTGLLPWALHKALSPNYAAYAFSSYDDGRFYTVQRVITADGAVHDGDVGDEVKFCPRYSDWVCADGPTFKFALPRHALRVGDHWRFSGVDYALLPSYMEAIPGGPVAGSETPLWSSRMFGGQYEFYTIKAGRQIFLYSPDQGLIGFMEIGDESVKDDVRNATFWLTGERGVGSVAFDSSVSSNALLSSDDVSELQH